MLRFDASYDLGAQRRPTNCISQSYRHSIQTVCTAFVVTKVLFQG